MPRKGEATRYKPPLRMPANDQAKRTAFGHWLRDRREALGMTQEDFIQKHREISKEQGLEYTRHTSWLSGMERGFNSFQDVDEFHIVAKVLDVGELELLQAMGWDVTSEEFKRVARDFDLTDLHTFTSGFDEWARESIMNIAREQIERRRRFES